jgi:hypothetical protein
MKIFGKNQRLTCIYCNAEQGYPAAPAIDFIPPILNMFGKLDHKNTKYQHSVQQEQCEDCNQIFYLRLNEEDKIVAANLPDKCYEGNKIS